ncbi:conserved hypothetical protein [Burkholderia pseudomallei Pasteur 52237]|nr:conserved hypothetical protein [Burkholderia pseudomallei Pasteur 52237]EEP84728.1 conserved hypothetical protein [Burkholderia mallei GB8 horse 4]
MRFGVDAPPPMGSRRGIASFRGESARWDVGALRCRTRLREPCDANGDVTGKSRA